MQGTRPERKLIRFGFKCRAAKYSALRVTWRCPVQLCSNQYERRQATIEGLCEFTIDVVSPCPPFLLPVSRIPLNVQTKLVVELQFKDSAGVQSKGGKDNLG